MPKKRSKPKSPAKPPPKPKKPSRHPEVDRIINKPRQGPRPKRTKRY